MVSTLVIHVNAWIATHLPAPEGWKVELALAGLSDILHTKWSPVNHR